jgi:hypothetical protein
MPCLTTAAQPGTSVSKVRNLHLFGVPSHLFDSFYIIGTTLPKSNAARVRFEGSHLHLVGRAITSLQFIALSVPYVTRAIQLLKVRFEG